MTIFLPKDYIVYKKGCEEGSPASLVDREIGNIHLQQFCIIDLQQLHETPSLLHELYHVIDHHVQHTH